MRSTGVTRKVKKLIEELGRGSTFSYSDFKDLPFIAVSKILSRMVSRGELTRVKKGVYHYPKETALGKTVPKADDVLSHSNWSSSLYTYAAGATFAPYALGLTTQVPSEKVLIGDHTNRSLSILGSKYKIRRRPTKHLKHLSDKEFYLLETIRSLKVIPATSTKDAILSIVKLLRKSNHENLIKAALYEPPRVRAVLGAILEEIGTKEDLTKLKKSLNALTTYKLNISHLLKKADEWKIK